MPLSFGMSIIKLEKVRIYKMTPQLLKEIETD